MANSSFALRNFLNSFFFFQYVPSRLVVSVDVEPGEVEGGNDLPLPFLGALW